MSNKYGPRRPVIGGGVIMLVCFLGISLARNIVQFSVLTIVWGIGVSMAYTPPLAILLTYFHTKSALPIGISATGAAFGMMVYPPLTELLIEMYGWRGASLIFAAMNANICVFGAFIKPPSPVYVVLATDYSSQEHTLQSGASKLDIIWSRCTDSANGLCKILALEVLREEPKFTIHAVVCFVLGIMYSAWMIYLIPHAVTRGIESQQATLLSTAGGFGTLVGRILYGPVLHREYIKPVQMFILLAFANFGAFVLDPVVASNYPGLVCLASVNGISLGTMASLFILMSQQVLDGVVVNRAWCTLCVFFAVGELAGGAFAGFVYEISGSYEVSFLFLGGLSAAIVFILVVERLLS